MSAFVERMIRQTPCGMPSEISQGLNLIFGTVRVLGFFCFFDTVKVSTQ